MSYIVIYFIHMDPFSKSSFPVSMEDTTPIINEMFYYRRNVITGITLHCFVVTLSYKDRNNA